MAYKDRWKLRGSPIVETPQTSGDKQVQKPTISASQTVTLETLQEALVGGLEGLGLSLPEGGRVSFKPIAGEPGKPARIYSIDYVVPYESRGDFILPKVKIENVPPQR